MVLSVLLVNNLEDTLLAIFYITLIGP